MKIEPNDTTADMAVLLSVRESRTVYLRDNEDLALFDLCLASDNGGKRSRSHGLPGVAFWGVLEGVEAWTVFVVDAGAVSP